MSAKVVKDGATARSSKPADERFYLAPREAGVLVLDIGGAGVTELRIAADLLKFVKKGIQLSRIERNLAALPGNLQKAALLAILISARCGCARTAQPR
jgi:hypothetical protein